MRILCAVQQFLDFRPFLDYVSPHREARQRETIEQKRREARRLHFRRECPRLEYCQSVAPPGRRRRGLPGTLRAGAEQESHAS
jgi:hypothetical protein